MRYSLRLSVCTAKPRKTNIVKPPIRIRFNAPGSGALTTSKTVKADDSGPEKRSSVKTEADLNSVPFDMFAFRSIVSAKVMRPLGSSLELMNTRGDPFNPLS
jgi:hypothetical protein